MLIDPNSLSADGTRALTSFSVTSDGTRAACGLSDAGSDWATFAVLELATGAEVKDVPATTKFSPAAGCRTAARTPTPTSPSPPPGRTAPRTYACLGSGGGGTTVTGSE